VRSTQVRRLSRRLLQVLSAAIAITVALPVSSALADTQGTVGDPAVCNPRSGWQTARVQGVIDDVIPNLQQNVVVYYDFCVVRKRNRANRPYRIEYVAANVQTHGVPTIIHLEVTDGSWRGVPSQLATFDFKEKHDLFGTRTLFAVGGRFEIDTVRREVRLCSNGCVVNGY
jgi:hypothetical protein